MSPQTTLATIPSFCWIQIHLHEKFPWPLWVTSGRKS